MLVLFTILTTFTFCIIGYSCGNILFGSIIAKLRKTNLRSIGSGNIGATNSLRAMGKTIGLIVMLLDAIKAYLAVIIAWTIYLFTINKWFPKGHELYTIVYLAGICAIIGHCFPITYLFNLIRYGFKKQKTLMSIGGKGMSCTVGVIAAINPFLAVILIIIWLTVFLIFKKVSIGSICTVLFTPSFTFIREINLQYLFGNGLYNNHLWFIINDSYTSNIYLFVGIFMLLTISSYIVVIRHISNIKKIIEEIKIEAKSK